MAATNCNQACRHGHDEHQSGKEGGFNNIVGVRWSALKNAKVEHGDNFTVLKGPPQSSDLNAVPSISKADVTK